MKKSLKSAAFAAALVFLGSFLFVSCDNTVGGTGNTSISAPTLNSATYSSSTNKVTLSWSEVSGADHYIISEAYGSGSYVELDGEMTGSSCAITDFTKSGTFYYKVKAVSASGAESVYSTAKSVYVSYSAISYGSHSDVPSDAILMTINNYSDSSWTYKTSYIQPSTTKYYYFYGSAGTKYYIQMCDSQDGSSQLTEWGYSLKIDTKVSCYLAGSSTKLIENDDAAWTSKPYFTAVSTGYYVVAVTSWSSTITSAGYFGVGVIKQ